MNPTSHQDSRIVIASADTGRELKRLPLASHPLLFANGGPASSFSEAELAVYRDARGAAWAVLSEAAMATARCAGSVPAGRLVRLTGRELRVDGLVYSVPASEPLVRVVPAPRDMTCPVCELPIRAGEMVWRCPCGLQTDSRFCSMGGAQEPRCFRCGTPLDEERCDDV